MIQKYYFFHCLPNVFEQKNTETFSPNLGLSWGGGGQDGKSHFPPVFFTLTFVHKGLTKLNMFSVFDEPFKRLCSKQAKLNFWNQLHQKIDYLCPFLKTNSHLTTKPYNFDLKCRYNLESYYKYGCFDTKFRGVRVFYYLTWKVIFTRESTLGLTVWAFSYSISLYRVKA